MTSNYNFPEHYRLQFMYCSLLSRTLEAPLRQISLLMLFFFVDLTAP